MSTALSHQHAPCNRSVIMFCIQLFRERLTEKMYTRQSRKVIWDMITGIHFRRILSNAVWGTVNSKPATIRDYRVHFFWQPHDIAVCCSLVKHPPERGKVLEQYLSIGEPLMSLKSYSVWDQKTLKCIPPLFRRTPSVFLCCLGTKDKVSAVVFLSYLLACNIPL